MTLECRESSLVHCAGVSAGDSEAHSMIDWIIFIYTLVLQVSGNDLCLRKGVRSFHAPVAFANLWEISAACAPSVFSYTPRYFTTSVVGTRRPGLMAAPPSLHEGQWQCDNFRPVSQCENVCVFPCLTAGVDICACWILILFCWLDFVDCEEVFPFPCFLWKSKPYHLLTRYLTLGW